MQQFLLRLPRIRSRWLLFTRSGKSSRPFNLFTTYHKENVITKKSCLPQSRLLHLPQSGYQQGCETSDFLFLLLFLVSYPPSTTALRFPQSSLMNIRLGNSTKFPIPSVSLPPSSFSTVRTLYLILIGEETIGC